MAAAVMDVFKPKPVDLEPIYAAWSPAPLFLGNPKKDPSVDDWLTAIKNGCTERHVPREYWHKVGYHYMGPKARARMDEVKKVMQNMHGGKYKWNWKSFKVAMKSMGWDTASEKTGDIKVQAKSSGIWWIIGKGSRDDDDAKSLPPSAPPTPPRPTPKKSKTTWEMSTFKPFPTRGRSATMSQIDSVVEPSSIPPPVPPKTPPKKVRKTEKSVVVAASAPAPLPSPPSTALTTDSTTVGQAPIWLLNACTALDFLTTEHPKVMSALSAVLITVGSIPAIPAISAGAGGAFLASGTAHALGSIAVGIGSWLKANSEQSNQPTQAQAQIQPA
ncbi:hypothetical protein NLI96_g6678 [Meripilus lineatus]|uniref:Uncharacterized protein n=1 Tax=Meripilus lineatus TaxID=2056292 RepID=A0AAD5YDM7_9APHY|nr:hypothetical protein NLI96_g6678 [Physisporinus lineatus]